MITASVLKGLNICDELVSELKYVSTKEIYGLAFVGVKQQSWFWNKLRNILFPKQIQLLENTNMHCYHDKRLDSKKNTEKTCPIFK